MTHEHQSVPGLNDKLFRSMSLIGAEAAGGLPLLFASAVVAACRRPVGFAISPFAVLALAAAPRACLVVVEAAGHDRPGLAAAAFAILTTARCLAGCVAGAPRLPDRERLGSAHHPRPRLPRTARRLPHDAILGARRDDRLHAGRPPLAVLAGGVYRDALHALHPVVALTARSRAVSSFSVARRLMPDGIPRVPFAIVAALLLWLPHNALRAGLVHEQSFVSQVAAGAVRDRDGGRSRVTGQPEATSAMALFALFGVAGFLTWPDLDRTRADPDPRGGRKHAARASCPATPGPSGGRASSRIAIVTAIYVHPPGWLPHGERRAAIWPTPRTLGWPPSSWPPPGIVWAAFDRRARSAALVFAAIALQGAALVVTGRSIGATTPYLSLKMAYLAIYPLSSPQR
jgi:hypothetical protein